MSPLSMLRTALLLAVAVAGVAAAQDAAQDPAPAPATDDVPIPEKVPSPPSEEGAPTVTIRDTESGDRVEEYRQNGQVYMVRVTPKHGKPYYLYDDDRNGRLDRSDAERNDISPVYWTIYEWD